LFEKQDRDTLITKWFKGEIKQKLIAIKEKYKQQ
jgi:hypothetical protein